MRPLLFLTAAAVFGCGGVSARGPRLSAIVPSQGANDVAVEVDVTGEQFEPRVYTDFGQPSRSYRDDGFSAVLVPTEPALAEVELGQVQLTADGALHAVVPPLAARGFYGLRVRDAFGREGFLPEVYRVVASPNRLATFEFERVGPQRPGVPFTVQLTAVDADGQTVDGFVGNAFVSDRTGTLTPGSIGPFNLGRARQQVSVAAFSPSDALLAADATGKTGTSNDFPVSPGLAVQLAFLSAPQLLPVATCSAKVEMEARDSFGFPSDLEAAVSARLDAAPPDGFTFFSDSACTLPVSQATVPAGGGHLEFYFRGDTSGVVGVRVVPEIFPNSTQVQTLTPLAPSQLAFGTPERSIRAGECSLPVTVRTLDRLGNASPVDQLTELTLSAQPAASVGFFSDAACSVPTGSASVPAGASSASFYLWGQAVGDLEVGVAAVVPGMLAPAVQTATVRP